MEAETVPVEADEEAENCEELDDNFFNEIGQTFDVVDAWDDGEDEGSNSNQVPLPQIKIEPTDSEKSPNKKDGKSSKESRSSRVRTESDRSDSRNRDPRSKPSDRDKENDKKSKSPERRRPSRFSPPRGPPRTNRGTRFSPPRRRNSPPRRNNQANNGRPSFMDEMVSQFPEIRNDLMSTSQMQYNAPTNIYGMQMPMQQNFMVQPNFMAQQQFTNVPFMAQISVDQFGQPLQQFANPMMTSIIPPGTSAISPMPVPAPIDAPPPPLLRTPSGNAQDPRLKPQQSIAEQLRKATTREVDLQQVKAKAFQEGKIGLTDWLKQVSHQSSKKASSAEIVSKKSKVHERCKEAAKIIEEINANKARLPFMLKPSEKQVPTMKSDPKMGMRSPLTMSDTNMQFLSQAKIASCRDAIQANPLRNISGNLFQLCRNAGLDLVNVSQKVQRKIEVEREKEMRLTQSMDISINVFDASKKKVQRGCQTDRIICSTCEERSTRDDEPGNFIVHLDAQSIDNLSRDQHHALTEFCRAFNIVDNRFKPAQQRSQWDSDNEEEQQQPPSQRDDDDHMTYANPENPNMDDDKGFITFSPIRRLQSRSPLRRSRSRSPSRRSRSRSPKRRRITDRLGVKIPSPRNTRFRDDEERLLNPTEPYRIPSPPPRVERSYGRLSPSNGYREKSRSLSPRPRYREKRSRTPERGQRRGRY